MPGNPTTRVRIGCLAATVIALTIGVARAASDVETSGLATAMIAAVFSIEVDASSVGFGSVQPGGGASDFPAAITVTLRTNAGGLFALKARLGVEIPGATLSFRTRSTGKGGSCQAWTILRPAGAVAYVATAAEAHGNLPGGTAVTFDYRAVTGAEAAPGPKAWTVTLTFAGSP
jgi:hypothetical protein